jgi:hypothetical protein
MPPRTSGANHLASYEARILARALADIEAPHIAVLQFLDANPVLPQAQPPVPNTANCSRWAGTCRS